MSEWRECNLGDAIMLKRGHDLPESKRKDGGYPVYSSSGITGFHSDYKIAGSGVITGRYGTIGQVFYAESAHWPLNTTLYVENFKGNDKKFIYYFLQTLDWDSYADIASAVPGINRNHVHLAKVSIPVCTEEQHTIAEVLSSLDDKIDLLSRQNATLGDLAQTYFRQWFVENANEDWEEKGLDEIADFSNGLPLQNYPCKSGEPIKVIKIKELNSGYSDNSAICSQDVPEKYIVHLGDIIFSWSGSLVVDIWKYDAGALNQHLFKVTSSKYPKWFYYYWIKYHLPEFRSIAESKATTMGHIQRGHLTAAKVLMPSEIELEVMGETMQPLIEKIECNNAQILTLQKLRETLLPKLISGEVRVKEV